MAPSHPNRSKRNPSPHRNPTPEEVRAARAAAGLTQTQAALLVHATLSAWMRWEQGVDYESGRRMHPGLWELFRLKVGQITVDDLWYGEER